MTEKLSPGTNLCQSRLVPYVPPPRSQDKAGQATATARSNLPLPKAPPAGRLTLSLHSTLYEVMLEEDVTGNPHSTGHTAKN